MSRECKKNRDVRRRASFTNWFWHLVNQIAIKEGRALQTDVERECFVRELKQRGVIVDQGPHPSGHGRKISILIERLPPDSQPEFDSLESLFATLQQHNEKEAA